MIATPDLELPLALSDPWDHALFLSYGLDLPFFERAILPNLAGSCRNRILLGDEKTYLASCDHFAESRLVRHANSQYVAEPILRRPSSHAKLVLLTNAEAGWLAVGSGNLSMQGYASGGELFTAYTYTAEDATDIAEFVAVRALLERLRDDGRLTRTAAWHLDQLLEGSPWLFRAAPGPSRVRHNLDTSFLDQLTDAVGGDHVDRLWALAPFFDRDAHALAHLIDRLTPDQTTVLLQAGRTSVDPSALEEVASRPGYSVELRSVSRPDDAWIHAKLFVAQTPTGAVCLQGSANASIAALERTDPDCNFEMANLLSGPRNAFDNVLGGLQIGDPLPNATALDLTYQSSDDSDHLDVAGWQLTGAEWIDQVLHISYRGVLLDTSNLQLIVRGTSLAAEVSDRGPPLVLKFSDEVAELLGGADPVRLQFADGARSNAIFPCDRASLNATLHASPEGDERLTRIGHLDLDDEELELLLQELQATMVLDRRSIWQLAGDRAGPDESAADDELHIDYSEIDYEMLRGHPRLRQYLQSSGESGPHARSRLQLVLEAITNSFGDLLNPADASTTAAAVAAITEEGDKGVQTEDSESDEDEVEVHRRQWSRQARINTLLNNFIKRFVAGLSSTAFQDFAGPEVVASNYVIFLHLLARLYEREWVDADALIEATASTMELMWGTEQSPGYVDRLNSEEGGMVLSIVRDQHSDAQLFALVYLYARDARVSHLTDVRVRIRNAWRSLLLGNKLPLDRVVVHDAGVLLRPTDPPDGPRLSDVLEELRLLADFRTRPEMMAALNQRFQLTRGIWRFEKVTVHSPSLGEEISTEALTVEEEELVFSLQDAQWTLAAWMQVEARGYYRVQITSRKRRTRFVAFYEPATGRGSYAALELREKPVALTNLHAPPAPWDDGILDLMDAAEKEDLSALPGEAEQASP